jgi:hypothetical protein
MFIVGEEADSATGPMGGGTGAALPARATSVVVVTAACAGSLEVVVESDDPIAGVLVAVDVVTGPDTVDDEELAVDEVVLLPGEMVVGGATVVIDEVDVEDVVGADEDVVDAPSTVNPVEAQESDPCRHA